MAKKPILVRGLMIVQWVGGSPMLVFLRRLVYATMVIEGCHGMPLLFDSCQRDPFTEVRIACGGAAARVYPLASSLARLGSVN